MKKQEAIEKLKELLKSLKDRRAIKAERKKLASKAFNEKRKQTNYGLNDPNRYHALGINKPYRESDPGTSVIGHHLKEKTSPVIPVKEQAMDKLRYLRMAPKPNLPKKEMEKSEGDKMEPKSMLEVAKELLKSAQEGKLQEELSKAKQMPVPKEQGGMKKEQMDENKKAPAMMSKEEDQPDEEDIFFHNSGPLGARTSVSAGGKHIGEFSSEEEAYAAAKKWSEKNKFWPTAWFMSDHGNHHMIKDFHSGAKMNKKEILKVAKELIKMTKALSTPAPAPAAPKAKMPAPKAPAMKAPAMKAPAAKQAPAMMTKEEIKADLKKEFKPKFKKECK